MDATFNTKKNRRSAQIAMALGLVVAFATGTLATVSADAALDDGQFCIVASSDEGKFTGERGPAGCGEGASQPEQPVEPEQPVDWTIPAFACSITLGWPEHTLAASWDPVPGAAQYRVKATSPHADLKSSTTTTETSASLKVSQWGLSYAFITVEAVDAGGARLRISQGYANMSPFGQADSLCSEVLTPIE